jgi:tetratricopeptide (TPR) repeat protein
MELRPDLAIVRVNLGWVHLSSGRYDEAAEQFEVAASMLTDTDTPYAWRMTYANWGAALAKAGRNAEGLAKVDYALSFEPDHTDLLRLAAEIELAMNQSEAARIRLQKAITKDPEDVQAYEILTRSFLLEENLTDAIASLVRTIQLVPHHYDARMQLAELLDKQGQSQAASDLYLGLINELSSIDHPKVKSFLIKAHSKLAWNLATSFDEKIREPVRSLELAQHAAGLSAPPEALTLSVLAAAHAVNEQFDKAVEHAGQALSLAQEAGDQSLTERIGKQLEAYRLGHLYIENRPTTVDTKIQSP